MKNDSKSPKISNSIKQEHIVKVEPKDFDSTNLSITNINSRQVQSNSDLIDAPFPIFPSVYHQNVSIKNEPSDEHLMEDLPFHYQLLGQQFNPSAPSLYPMSSKFINAHGSSKSQSRKKRSNKKKPKQSKQTPIFQSRYHPRSMIRERQSLYGGVVLGGNPSSGDARQRCLQAAAARMSAATSTSKSFPTVPVSNQVAEGYIESSQKAYLLNNEMEIKRQNVLTRIDALYDIEKRSPPFTYRMWSLFDLQQHLRFIREFRSSEKLGSAHSESEEHDFKSEPMGPISAYESANALSHHENSKNTSPSQITHDLLLKEAENDDTCNEKEMLSKEIEQVYGIEKRSPPVSLRKWSVILLQQYLSFVKHFNASKDTL